MQWLQTRFALASSGLLLALAVAGCGTGLPDGYAPRTGDLLFQSLPRSPLVDVIEGTTGSPYSHCGLVVAQGDEVFVLEALGTVRLTSLHDFARRSRDGELSVYRFREPWIDSVPEVVEEARVFLGRPYDARYRMDDEAIYCSELIYKAFRAATGNDLGELDTLGSLNWQPFEEFIRQQEGGSVPLEREMITPVGLSHASQLRRVHPPAP